VRGMLGSRGAIQSVDRGLGGRIRKGVGGPLSYHYIAAAIAVFVIRSTRRDDKYQVLVIQ